MSKRMIWGLGVLMLLIVTVFVFMTVRDRAEIRQLKKEAAEAEKLLEESTKQQEVQTPIDYTKPPPGKTFANGGHWHNGEWHDEPHTDTVEADVQHVSFEPDDTWRLYPDNIWRKKGEQPIPNTVPPELKLPEDVFSDAYTERVKELVQTYVEYKNVGDLRRFALHNEISKVSNAMSKLSNIYRSDVENNRYARERRVELSKLLEPYQATILRPKRRNHPSPLEKLRDLQEKSKVLPSKADLDAVQRRNNQ